MPNKAAVIPTEQGTDVPSLANNGQDGKAQSLDASARHTLSSDEYSAQDAARLRIYLLGTFQITLDGAPLQGLRSVKTSALLAYLAVEDNRPHWREELATLLWGDYAAKAARGSVRKALSNLRAILAPLWDKTDGENPFLEITRQSVQFNTTGPEIWTDVAEFEMLWSTYGVQREGDELATSAGTVLLAKAAELYRGDFLTGFNLDDCPEYEEWRRLYQQKFHHQALATLEILADHHLNLGNPVQVQHFAQRQLALEPWHEKAHRQLMLALAMAGQRGAALVQFRTCCQNLKENLGVGPEAETVALYEQIKRGEVTGDGQRTVVLKQDSGTLPPCPYPGLRSYRQEDAKMFSGRNTAVGEILKAVDRRDLVVVAGPSGSGKSSLVNAGVLPLLKQGDHPRLVISFRPRGQPFKALAAALIPHLEPDLGPTDQLIQAGKLGEALEEGYLSLAVVLQRIWSKRGANHRDLIPVLIAVDHLDELWSECADHDLRQRFLDVLTSPSSQLPASPLRAQLYTLLISMRGYALDRLGEHPAFASTLKDAVIEVTPLARYDLAQAAIVPAMQRGVSYESGLIERIVEDVGSEQGNLCVLQLTLTDLWKQQAQGQFLTHVAYDAIGQVKGSLSRYADIVLSRMDPSEQVRAQRALLQLVQPGVQASDTLRHATRAELGEDLWEMILQLAEARLVLVERNAEGQSTTRLIHTGLLEKWERLRSWLDAERSYRLWEERFRTAQYHWDVGGRSEKYLLRGVMLDEAESWQHKQQIQLSDTARQFLSESIAFRDKERQEQEQMRAARVQLKRQAIFGVIATLTLLTILSLWGRQGWSRAEELRMLALSNRLAAQALNHVQTEQLPLALSLGLQAYALSPTTEAQSSILSGLLHAPMLAAFDSNVNGLQSKAISSDARTVVVTDPEGDVLLWDTQSNQLTNLSTAQDGGPIQTVTLSADGKRLALGAANGQVSIWNMPGLLQQGEAQQLRASPVTALAFDGGGQHLVSGYADGAVAVWTISPTGLSGAELGVGPAVVRSLAFSPVDSQLAVGYAQPANEQEIAVEIWDWRTGERLRRLDGGKVEPLSLEFDDSGKRLTALLADGSLEQWNLEADHVDRNTIVLSNGESDAVLTDLAYSADASVLALGYDNGSILLWDTTVKQIKQRFSGFHDEPVSQLAFSDDGRSLVSSAADGCMYAWSLANPLARMVSHVEDDVRSVATSASGELIALGLENGDIHLLDATTGYAFLRPLEGHTAAVTDLEFSPDETTLASASEDGSIFFWNLSNGLALGAPLHGHTEAVEAIAFSPDGERLASGGRDNTVILWDVAMRKPLMSPLSQHSHDVRALAMSPDGKYLASGSADHTVLLWDLSTQPPQATPYLGHDAEVTSVAFSADGKRLASGDAAGVIHMWAVDSPGDSAEIVSGYVGPVIDLMFDKTGQILFSAGCSKLIAGDCAAGAISLWSTRSQELIGQPLIEQGSDITAVALTPDGETLYATYSRAARLPARLLAWDVSFNSWRKRACRVIHETPDRSVWEAYLGDEPYRDICSE